MRVFLLDTHLWLWFQSGDGVRLGSDAVRQLETSQRKGQLYVSPVSAWEIGLLVAHQQLTLPLSVEQWVRTGIADGGLQMVDLTADILIESTRLPGDLHKDPADRMLLATARANGLTLLTRDKALVRYGKQGHAEVIRR